MLSINIQGLETGDFWTWFIILTVACIASFVATFVFFQRARIIEDTPTSRIRSAAQGYVELEGIADDLPNNKLISPLTKNACVWFEYEIERYVGGKHSRWVTEEKDESEQHFILKDDTGQCLVNPVDATITPECSVVWYGHTRQPDFSTAPQGYRSDSTVFSIGMGRYRYTEKRLHASDHIYALGDFRTYQSARQIPSLNEAISDRLKRLKKNKEWLLRHYDKDGDGNIDMDEWERARKDAIRMIQEEYADSPEAGIHVLDKSSERRLPFLLSAYPQDDLTSKYKMYSWGTLAAFFITGAIATYMLTARLA